jgi:low affinity Fe/Cu permease
MTKKFGKFANWVAVASGHPVAFGIAMITVAVWLGIGPLFSFSDTWQLVMNTWTSVDLSDGVLNSKLAESRQLGDPDEAR